MWECCLEFINKEPKALTIATQQCKRLFCAKLGALGEEKGLSRPKIGFWPKGYLWAHTHTNNILGPLLRIIPYLLSRKSCWFSGFQQQYTRHFIWGAKSLWGFLLKDYEEIRVLKVGCKAIECKLLLLLLLPQRVNISGGFITKTMPWQECSLGSN